MNFFDLNIVKKRIKETRTSLKITKMKLEEEGIICRRHLQKVEDLENKAFLSLYKLIDIADFF